MKYLALTIPHYGEVQAPTGIPSGTTSPSDIINVGIALLVALGIIASLIFLLYGGILWITSQGDKGKIDHARRTITFSIVGLIVIILSFVIVRTVGYLLGVPLLSGFGL